MHAGFLSITLPRHQPAGAHVEISSPGSPVDVHCPVQPGMVFHRMVLLTGKAQQKLIPLFSTAFDNKHKTLSRHEAGGAGSGVTSIEPVSISFLRSHLFPRQSLHFAILPHAD